VWCSSCWREGAAGVSEVVSSWLGVGGGVVCCRCVRVGSCAMLHQAARAGSQQCDSDK
jgi:hypothetical protein